MHLQSSGPSRCPVCLRGKEHAIREQLELGSSCGNSNCVFAKDIEKGLKNSILSTYCINCGNKFAHGDVFCIICGCRRK